MSAGVGSLKEKGAVGNVTGLIGLAPYSLNNQSVQYPVLITCSNV
jgi:hypothetical protein